jgi:mono/diheme cytochrome c family protein
MNWATIIVFWLAIALYDATEHWRDEASLQTVNMTREGRWRSGATGVDPPAPRITCDRLSFIEAAPGLGCVCTFAGSSVGKYAGTFRNTLDANRAMPKPAAVTADRETVTQGQVVYQRHCRYCHGDNLRTGGVTPDLRWSSQSIHDQWQAIVREGMLEGRGMVNFSEYVSAEDAEAIRQYVLHEANPPLWGTQPAAGITADARIALPQ